MGGPVFPEAQQNYKDDGGKAELCLPFSQNQFLQHLTQSLIWAYLCKSSGAESGVAKILYVCLPFCSSFSIFRLAFWEEPVCYSAVKTALSVPC